MLKLASTGADATDMSPACSTIHDADHDCAHARLIAYSRRRLGAALSAKTLAEIITFSSSSLPPLPPEPCDCHRQADFAAGRLTNRPGGGIPQVCHI